MKTGTDMQLGGQSFKHAVIGITTLEKIIEQILSTSIYDEKDYEKRHMKDLAGGGGMLYDNHYSMTVLNEESNANMQEMTELLNETAQNINHLS